MLKALLTAIALSLALAASAHAAPVRVLVFHPDAAGNPEVAAGPTHVDGFEPAPAAMKWAAASIVCHSDARHALSEPSPQ